MLVPTGSRQRNTALYLNSSKSLIGLMIPPSTRNAKYLCGMYPLLRAVILVFFFPCFPPKPLLVDLGFSYSFENATAIDYSGHCNMLHIAESHHAIVSALWFNIRTLCSCLSPRESIHLQYD